MLIVTLLQLGISLTDIEECRGRECAQKLEKAKNEVLKIHDPFLKLLKKEYYKGNERFDFVKSMKNFDGDDEIEVEPIKIEDTYATFRIGKNKYFSVSLIGGELVISAKWEDNEDKPILSNTLIYRKMKKI